MAENTQIARIVQTAACGDAAHFRELYELLVDRVYAYVRYRTSTEEQARDLTQDVFVDLHQALPQFTYQSDGQFYAFVFTITRRKLAKHYAKVNTEAAFREDGVDPDRVASSVGESEQVDAVTRALAMLDDTAREIVVLHHWSRYTFGEIATMLASTESAVRTRHHRALKTLATHLSND